MREATLSATAPPPPSAGVSSPMRTTSRTPTPPGANSASKPKMYPKANTPAARGPSPRALRGAGRRPGPPGPPPRPRGRAPGPRSAPALPGVVAPGVAREPDAGRPAVGEPLAPPRQHSPPRLDLNRVRHEHDQRREGDPAGPRGEHHVQRAEFAPILDDRLPDHPGHDARDGELQAPPEPLTHARHGCAAPPPRRTGPRSAPRRRQARNAAAGRPRPPPPGAGTRGRRRAVRWPGRSRAHRATRGGRLPSPVR